MSYESGNPERRPESSRTCAVGQVPGSSADSAPETPAQRLRHTLNPANESVARLVDALGVSRLVATLLVNRGHESVLEARRFLEPKLADLPSPFLMKGMRKAVDRILVAIRDDEPILVWGDYDVDGVTSISQIVLFMRELGVQVAYHVPNRLQDGYGLSIERLESLVDEGVRLLVTVDCGISAVEEISRAQELGLDVIIIDHHQVPPVLPKALAVIDPHQPDCPFPFSDLAACGLVFFFLIALRSELRRRGVFSRMREPDLREYLDLVGFGTIADMVSLSGVNRVLAVRGLHQLSRSARPGIQALREVCGVNGRSVDGTAVGFELGPRVNAVGRLGNARLAVELLTAVEMGSARALAGEVDDANRRRREAQKGIFEEVVERIEADRRSGETSAIVLGDDSWHTGVMGIVASKVVERYERPSILVAFEGDVGRGSGRSVPGVDLFDALGACSSHLDAFGGHHMAVGLTVRRSKFESFRAAFLESMNERVGGFTALTPLEVDAEVGLEEVNWDLLRDVNLLGPYGTDNPAPLFLVRAARIESARVVGCDHLQLLLRQGETLRSAIAFGMAHLRPEEGSERDVVFQLEVDRWRGQESLRLRVVALD